MATKVERQARLGRLAYEMTEAGFKTILTVVANNQAIPDGMKKEAIQEYCEALEFANSLKNLFNQREEEEKKGKETK